MIKIKLRKNLLYLLAYYISWYIRKIINMIISSLYKTYSDYIFLYLMTLGEMIGGFIILIYQKNSWKKKKRVKYFGLELIYSGNKRKGFDGIIKRIILIFLAAFYDYLEFYFGNFFVPSVDSNVSPTIDFRLGCLTTIMSSFICSNALGFKIGKHHRFALLFMILCFFLSLITDISFKPGNISFKRFIFARFLVCYSLMGVSFCDCTEKYLVDVNFINPFKILMLEGTFEFIAASLMSIGQDPFGDITKLYEEKSTREFATFIILLIIVLILSVIINAYKIYCNVIYTPMARSSIDFFMGPIFNIYYFIWKDDFHKNYFYFFISEIINIITVFFSCVYNEYIILFFCGIEHDTKDEIVERALTHDNVTVELENNPNLDEGNTSIEYDKENFD